MFSPNKRVVIVFLSPFAQKTWGFSAPRFPGSQAPWQRHLNWEMSFASAKTFCCMNWKSKKTFKNMTFVPGFSNSFFGKNHSKEMLSFPKHDIISTFLSVHWEKILNCLVFNPHMVATLCSDRLVGKIVIAHLLMNTHHDNISKKMPLISLNFQAKFI